MKPSRLVAILLLPALVILCLGAIYLIITITRIPQQAEQLFGPPDPTLGKLELLYLSARLLSQTEQLTVPSDPNGDEIPFRIDLGESPSTTIQRLATQGLISDMRAFRDYLVYAGLDTSIQAGDYLLSPAMSPMEIAIRLQDATPLEVIFPILAGWRQEEIAASLPTSGLGFSPDEFLETAQRQQAEGYFLPGSYLFPRDITVEVFVREILESFEQEVRQEIREGWNRQGLSDHEAVILASIVERESVLDDEIPLIASVFLNRLREGIKLEADATVQYALGYNPNQETWWTNPLSKADLQVESPYNTYLYPGLPPGPICNPSLDSLRGVAFPAQTQYFYFRAACDESGRHVFAKTFQEHVENECP